MVTDLHLGLSLLSADYWVCWPKFSGCLCWLEFSNWVCWLLKLCWWWGWGFYCYYKKTNIGGRWVCWIDHDDYDDDCGGGAGDDLNRKPAGGNRKGKGVTNFLHESPSHKIRYIFLTSSTIFSWQAPQRFLRQALLHFLDKPHKNFLDKLHYIFLTSSLAFLNEPKPPEANSQ